MAKQKVIAQRRQGKSEALKGKSKYALKQEQKRNGNFTPESPFKEIESEPSEDLVRDMENMITELDQVPELDDEY